MAPATNVLPAETNLERPLPMWIRGVISVDSHVPAVMPRRYIPRAWDAYWEWNPATHHLTAGPSPHTAARASLPVPAALAGERGTP